MQTHAPPDTPDFDLAVVDPDGSLNPGGLGFAR